MLNAISVRNIVLIDQLDLALDNGMTVLTGETGAGKSILLDALTLALGGRGDASLVRAHRKSDFLVMSFLGLTQREVDRGDPYQSQCLETAECLSRELKLSKSQYKVTFQSRFGAAKWLQPYTEPTLVELAKSGRREVDVVFPGFVSDCLETLEEIGIAARQAFLGAGGRELNLIPCLNESPEWIEALKAIAARDP